MYTYIHTCTQKMCDCKTYPPAAMTPQLIGCVYIHIYIYIYIYTCDHTYLHKHGYIHTYTHIHTYTD